MEEAVNLQVYKVLRTGAGEKEEMIQYGSVRGFGFEFGLAWGVMGMVVVCNT